MNCGAEERVGEGGGAIEMLPQALAELRQSLAELFGFFFVRKRVAARGQLFLQRLEGGRHTLLGMVAVCLDCEERAGVRGWETELRRAELAASSAQTLLAAITRPKITLSV